MNAYFRKRLKQANTEEGFTLVEIVITILIIGILAAIAMPIWSKYQAVIQSQSQKADLASASILIEQEAIDNNGLYPTYLPNELKNNPAMKSYAYTYSNDRTQFCLQADTADGKWFVSSTDKTPSRTVCTQPNVGNGSSTPWQTPTVATPTFISSGNVWPSDSSSAVATIKVNPITCVLNSADQGEWGSATQASYLVKVTNTTKGQTLSSPWNTSSTITMNLPNWLPGNTITYQIQSKCTVTSGTAYEYLSGLSAPVSDSVAMFTVTPTTFTSAPTLTWSAGAAAPKLTAAWADAFCPSGTKYYYLELLQNGTVLWNPGVTLWATSQTSATNTAIIGGKATTVRLIVSCLLSDGRRINSSATDTSITSPLQPPSAPTYIKDDDAYGLTTVIPNRLYWPPVTCTLGVPIYQLIQSSPNNATSGYNITDTQTQRSFTAGTTYTYAVQAACKDGSLMSEGSVASPSVTFAARFSLPSVPAVPTGIASDSTGTSAIKDNHLTWDAVVCDSGGIPYYSVQEVLKDNTAVTPAPTDFFTGEAYNLPDSWLAYGSTVGFQIQALCRNASGSSAATAWSPTFSFTTTVPAPSRPSISNNGWGNLTWGTVSCVSGTTPQYYAQMTKFNSSSSSIGYGWTTGKVWAPGIYQGYSNSGHAQARCVGVNANSPSSGYGSTSSWTAGVNPPGKPSVYLTGGYIVHDRGGSCASHTTREVSYHITRSSDVNLWSGWTTASSWDYHSVTYGFPQGGYLYYSDTASCLSYSGPRSGNSSAATAVHP